MKPKNTGARAVQSTRSKVEHHIAAALHGLGLYELVHAFYRRFFKTYHKDSLKLHGTYFRPTDLAQLPPHARKIYEELKLQVRRGKQGGG